MPDTTDKPVIFAFHGYAAMIHKLVYRRRRQANVHVHGYEEEGTITRIPCLAAEGERATDRYRTTMERYNLYFGGHDDDMPKVRDRCWKA